MDNDLLTLIEALLATSAQTPARTLALENLVQAMLKRRKIIRKVSQLPDDLYRDIYAALQSALTEAIGQVASSRDAQRSLTPHQLNLWLTQATADVLTYERLTRLAVHLQGQPFRSKRWQYALQELFTAVNLSRKLKRPTQGYELIGHDAHLDITHEALLAAIKDIQKFDSSRAHFIGWLNQIYIGRRGSDFRDRQKDTLQRSHRRRLVPIKNALSRAVVRSRNPSTQQQLWLYLKSSVASARQDICLRLSLVICLLQRQLQDDPIAANHLLFELAEAITGRMVQFESMDAPKKHADQSEQVKEIASPETREPPRLLFLRDCLQSCETSLCGPVLKKHVRNKPKATFSRVMLLRAEGQTFKDIGETLGVLLPTVQKLFERNLEEAIACLKPCLDDKVELWEA